MSSPKDSLGLIGPMALNQARMSFFAFWAEGRVSVFRARRVAQTGPRTRARAPLNVSKGTAGSRWGSWGVQLHKKSAAISMEEGGAYGSILHIVGCF